MSIKQIADTVAKNIRGDCFTFTDETVGVSCIMQLFSQLGSLFKLTDVRHEMDHETFKLSGKLKRTDNTDCNVQIVFSEIEGNGLQVEIQEQFLLPIEGIVSRCLCIKGNECWRVTFEVKEDVTFTTLLTNALSVLGIELSAKVFGNSGLVSNIRFTYELPFIEKYQTELYSHDKDNFVYINKEKYFSLYFETSFRMDLPRISNEKNIGYLEARSFLLEKFGETYGFSFEGNLGVLNLEIPFMIRYGGNELRLSTVKGQKSGLRIPSINEIGKIMGVDDLNLPQNLSNLTNFECESIDLSVTANLKKLQSFGIVVSNTNVWQLSQTPDIRITNLMVGFTFIKKSTVFIGGDFELGDWCLKISAEYHEKAGWVFRSYISNMSENPLSLSQLFVKLCQFMGIQGIPFPLPDLMFIGAMVSFDTKSKQFSANIEIGKLACGFSFMPKGSHRLDLKSEYEISLSKLPVVGTDMHLLDDVTIKDINLISDNGNTVLSLLVAGRSLQLRLSQKPTAQMDIVNEGQNSGLKLQWFQMEKRFSVFTIHRLGFGSDGKSIIFAFDAELAVSGFQVMAEGMSVSVALSKDMQPSFRLAGLCVSYHNPQLSISGGFRHLSDSQGETYDGAISVAFGEISITAVGSYSEGSFLAYGILRAKIGGPPAFSITGLALGFGLNKYLQLPQINEIEAYPLVAAAMKTDFTVERLLEGMKNKISAMPGQNFLAAGIRFHSFGIADSFALLTVSFGQHLEVGLLGLSEITVPPMTKKDPIAKATLALKAVLLPEQGVFSVEAQLTKESYLLSRNCQITGGFAFYIWFGDSNKGDFVVTLGGYRDGYLKPKHYPNVPRLGFCWRVTPQLMLRGELYFALTPSMICAGGRLDAVFQQGPLRAWFTAYTDIEIGWKPFYYDLSVGVSLGASITLDFWLFSSTYTLEMSVDIKIKGPEFSGIAAIKWWIISFTIAFGEQVQPAYAISWDEFKDSFLKDNGKKKQDVGIISIQAAKGQVGTITVTEQSINKEIGILHADSAKFTVESLIPSTGITVNHTPLESDKGDTLGVLPMGKAALVSSLEICILEKSKGGDTPADCMPWGIFQNVPKALWGREKVKSRSGGEEELIKDVLTGASIQFTPKQFRSFPENSPLTLDILSEYEKVKKSFADTDVLVTDIKGVDAEFELLQSMAADITSKVESFAQEMKKEEFEFDFKPDLTIMAANAKSLFEEEFLLT